MAAYDYRCETDGVFELTMPLGTAPSTAACPECGTDAPRVFSAFGTKRSGGGAAGPMQPGAGGPLPMAASMRPNFNNMNL
ncbi:MAG TPA: zinc ribbon domain-containing protein [Miltoncostaeaceae bacterium]|nr:zinc ribbon domain-containing protein [Miltoncostaeaceae bacterium]